MKNDTCTLLMATVVVAHGSVSKNKLGLRKSLLAMAVCTTSYYQVLYSYPRGRAYKYFKKALNHNFQIMHALGFQHEHQRPDRDDYIEVFPENILPEAIFHFQIIYNDWSPFNKGKLCVESSIQLSLKRIRHQVNNALSWNCFCNGVYHFDT